MPHNFVYKKGFSSGAFRPSLTLTLLSRSPGSLPAVGRFAGAPCLAHLPVPFFGLLICTFIDLAGLKENTVYESSLLICSFTDFAGREENLF
jgi:hypothetical protein